jgi:putative tryptophan/tyrosine transport system substrate-binding protein
MAPKRPQACPPEGPLTTALGGAAVAWPLLVNAQQPSVRRIGVLMGRTADDPDGQEQAAALRRGLEELGWSLGHNFEIEYRWPAGNASLAQASAKELVELRPDILVANSTPSLIAARAATGTIPIVFVAIADPAAQGFVQSLARPGGNMTGFGTEEPSMGAKGAAAPRNCAPRRTDHGHLQSGLCPIRSNVSACNGSRPPVCCIRADRFAGSQ